MSTLYPGTLKSSYCLPDNLLSVLPFSPSLSYLGQTFLKYFCTLQLFYAPSLAWHSVFPGISVSGWVLTWYSQGSPSTQNSKVISSFIAVNSVKWPSQSGAASRRITKGLCELRTPWVFSEQTEASLSLQLQISCHSWCTYMCCLSPAA